MWAHCAHIPQKCTHNTMIHSDTTIHCMSLVMCLCISHAHYHDYTPQYDVYNIYTPENTIIHSVPTYKGWRVVTRDIWAPCICRRTVYTGTLVYKYCIHHAVVCSRDSVRAKCTNTSLLTCEHTVTVNVSECQPPKNGEIALETSRTPRLPWV